ncbi:MAG: ISNCY family transposase, partial [Desulfobulbia bacterium]
HFAPSESMRAYFETMAPYFRECGRPVAVYSDKHGIFRVNKGSTMETSVTQFGRAMKQLDIGTICAHSPQAKGRVERANGTLQDRLVKELRLKGISTIEEANAFLPQFQKDYNRRFAVPASDPIDAHRTLMSHNLECILSVQETRKVSKSLSFQYENTHYQILEEGWRAKQLIGQRITIVSTLSNETRVFFRDTELTYTRAELVPQRPKAVDSKELNAEMRKWLNKKPQYRPPITHPYKKRKNF